MRFISSAIHWAARSPAGVPGPRPSKRSSAMARVRAIRSAEVIAPVVSGCGGTSIGAAAIAPTASAAASSVPRPRNSATLVQGGVEAFAGGDELALTDNAQEVRDRNLATVDRHHARRLDTDALNVVQERHIALVRRRRRARGRRLEQIGLDENSLVRQKHHKHVGGVKLVLHVEELDLAPSIGDGAAVLHAHIMHLARRARECIGLDGLRMQGGSESFVYVEVLLLG